VKRRAFITLLGVGRVAARGARGQQAAKIPRMTHE